MQCALKRSTNASCIQRCFSISLSLSLSLSFSLSLSLTVLMQCVLKGGTIEKLHSKAVLKHVATVLIGSPLAVLLIVSAHVVLLLLLFH